MTTTVSGSYPAVNSDSDATINGLTVGKGGGAVSTNTVVGSGALAANTTNSNQTAIGYQAAAATNGSSFITAVGNQALLVNTSGRNTAIGNVAMVANTTGTQNTAIGDNASNQNTTGSYNVSVGFQALNSNTTASYNTAVGYQAKFAGTGSYNSCFGVGAGIAFTSGAENTLVGYYAGGSLTTGNKNLFIGGAQGSGSGGLVTTGNSNVVIGSFSGNQGGLDIRTASNNIILSDGDGNPRLQIDGSGTLNVPGANAPSMFGVYNNTTGSAANVHVLSSGALIRSTSSIKYKTDVQDATHGLAEVMQLRPVTYKGINDGELVFGGLIAEEVDAVGLTEFVQYADDGTPDALAYGNMVSLCVKAIQELNAKVTALETQLNNGA